MTSPSHENDCNKVSILRIVSVHPKIPHHHHLHSSVLELSNLDRQCPTLMHLVFFYNNQNSHQQNLKDYYNNNNLSLNNSSCSVFNRLQSGLEETLSEWYPGAGRLIRSNNQNDNGKLNLWCNNQGAVMVEAETKVKISQLGDLSQYSQFLEKLVYKPDFDGNFSNMPLIVAQVTKFGCGGYSIGIGTSHSLFDGPATYDFLNAWSSNSEIVKKTMPLELPKPVHERGILLSGNNNNNHQIQLPKGAIHLPSNSSSSSPNLNNNINNATRAIAIDHLYQLIMQAASGQKEFQVIQIGPSNHQNMCVLRTYHISGAMIDQLKRKHFSVKSGSLPFSSFEVLAAHLWKARTKALGVKKENMVCLQFAVDTRNKMMPPLPKGFAGNAYVLASVMMPAEQLEFASHEFVVEKIREAKNTVNHNYVKSYIDALELGSSSNNSLPPMKELTLVSDWTRMPFHNIEFFGGRKAEYACPIATPMPQVAYFMQSPSDSGGVDVRIGFEGESIISAFTQCFLIEG